jgi:hypothetical protein
MTKYDDFDWHIGAAVEANQPEDGAFTHIGFMLAWLIRRGMGNPDMFDQDIFRQVADGTLRPDDLRDLFDGKLIGDILEPEGAAFLDAYYSAYFQDYAAEFADLPDYGVPDDVEHEARIDRRIDDAHRRWLDAGRPAPDSPKALWEVAGVPELPADFDLTSVKMAWEYSGPEELLDKSLIPEGFEVVRVERPPSHVDPELEARVAAAICRPIELESLSSRHWGVASLNRALRNLGAQGAVMVLGRGPGWTDPSLEVHRVSGSPRDALATEFKRYIEHRAWARWRDGMVEDIPARWGKEKPPGSSNLVWFAIDEYVVYLVSSEDETALESMAVAMRAALEPT